MVCVTQVCWQLASRIRTELVPFPSWSCSQAVSKPVWHIPFLRAQWKTPDDAQRNCPKHVELYSKNKNWVINAPSWFYYKNLSRCTVTWTSKSFPSYSFISLRDLNIYAQQFAAAVSSETFLSLYRRGWCHIFQMAVTFIGLTVI